MSEHRVATLMGVGDVAELIRSGKYLSVAGDEQALRQLPTGNWIGGTIPYFMAEQGGVVSREQVYVNEIETFGESPLIRFYDLASLPRLCRNAPDNGYSLIIVPGFSEVHSSFARNAPNYEEMYLKPLVGWVAGVHLDDLGKVTPKVVHGQTGQFSDQMAVLVDVPLPNDKFARIDIVNLFTPGQGDDITFPETGFSAGDCLINGEPANFSDYLSGQGIDTRLPLVADYSGAMVNVSIKGNVSAERRVDFYAPVFPGTRYRFAAPVADYITALQSALPPMDSEPGFSCNCVLNYLYCELDGKRTGRITGPITFGEIAYQLLNQTLVYLSIDG
ncbi:MAG: DUF6976 family protein [Bacteroidota bacterium]